MQLLQVNDMPLLGLLSDRKNPPERPRLSRLL